jgi:hypothetical protein
MVQHQLEPLYVVQDTPWFHSSAIYRTASYQVEHNGREYIVESILVEKQCPKQRPNDLWCADWACPKSDVSKLTTINTTTATFGAMHINKFHVTWRGCLTPVSKFRGFQFLWSLNSVGPMGFIKFWFLYPPWISFTTWHRCMIMIIHFVVSILVVYFMSNIYHWGEHF